MSRYQPTADIEQLLAEHEDCLARLDSHGVGPGNAVFVFSCGTEVAYEIGSTAVARRAHVAQVLAEHIEAERDADLLAMAPEQREQWRKDAEALTFAAPISAQRILVLLDALDAAEAERDRYMAHAYVESVRGEAAEARLARLDDPALWERVADVVLPYMPDTEWRDDAALTAADAALAVVRKTLDQGE